MGSLKTLVTRLVPLVKGAVCQSHWDARVTKMVVLHTRSVHTQTSNLGLHSLSISLLRQSQKNACDVPNRYWAATQPPPSAPRPIKNTHTVPKSYEKGATLRHSVVSIMSSARWATVVLHRSQKPHKHTHIYTIVCVASEIQTKLHILSKHIHENINICKQT